MLVCLAFSAFGVTQIVEKVHRVNVHQAHMHVKETDAI